MGLDCPDFDVLETSGDVQLRRYRSARYITAKVKAESLLAAQLEGTKRLLAYLAGANEDRAKLLPPTVPLETIMFPVDKTSETVEGTFCIVLYLPDSAQDDPPEPTDRRVRIIHARTTDWFVLRIKTSIIDERSVIHRAWQFILDLEDQRGRCSVNRRVISFGVYDLPLPFIKPGYFEIAVPRRRHRRGCNQESLARRRGHGEQEEQDELVSSALVFDDADPSGGDAPPPGGEDDDPFGIDACEVCGDCAASAQ